MPFPNEHSARILDPKQFKKFRRKNNAGGKGVHFIYGILNSKTSKLQSIRFSVKEFTVKEAKAWLKKHKIKYIKFEPASKKARIIDYIFKQIGK